MVNHESQLSVDDRITLQNLVMDRMKNVSQSPDNSNHSMHISYDGGSILVDTRDFPNSWINMCHPDDNKIRRGQLISTEFIYNHGIGKIERTLLRTAAKGDNGYNCSISFIVDTGCPLPILLSKQSMEALISMDRILEDDKGDLYMCINNKNVGCKINDTHGDINLLGLPFLRRFNCIITLNDEQKSYYMNNFPTYI